MLVFSSTSTDTFKEISFLPILAKTAIIMMILPIAAWPVKLLNAAIFRQPDDIGFNPEIREKF